LTEHKSDSSSITEETIQPENKNGNSEKSIKESGHETRDGLLQIVAGLSDGMETEHVILTDTVNEQKAVEEEPITVSVKPRLQRSEMPVLTSLETREKTIERSTSIERLSMPKNEVFSLGIPSIESILFEMSAETSSLVNDDSDSNSSPRSNYESKNEAMLTENLLHNDAVADETDKLHTENDSSRDSPKHEKVSEVSTLEPSPKQTPEIPEESLVEASTKHTLTVDTVKMKDNSILTVDTSQSGDDTEEQSPSDSGIHSEQALSEGGSEGLQSPSEYGNGSVGSVTPSHETTAIEPEDRPVDRTEGEGEDLLSAVLSVGKRFSLIQLSEIRWLNPL